MTQSTVSRYVIVILLLGNMTLLQTLPQVTWHFGIQFKFYVITFRVSRRRRKIYIGHARLFVCVCLSVPRRIPTLLHG